MAEKYELEGIQNNMQTITDKMGNYICSNLCVFRHMAADETDLEIKCAECEMREHICDILNRNEADRAAGEALETVIREKAEALKKEVEGISRVIESLPVIDSYYVNGRQNEMTKFQTWLESLVPPAKVIPEACKKHITNRFEKVE